MPTQTLLLLAVLAVIVGYAAFTSPALGGALAVAAAVVGILYVIIKDAQDDGGRPGRELTPVTTRADLWGTRIRNLIWRVLVSKNRSVPERCSYDSHRAAGVVQEGCPAAP